MTHDRATRQLEGAEPELLIDEVAVEAVAGPARGRRWESAGERIAIGSHQSNDVVLDDPAVSRFHCELSIGRDRVTLRDLGSRNGTAVDGVRIVEAFVRDGSILAVGKSSLRIALSGNRRPLPLSSRTELGRLVGVSPAMRAVFAVLEKAAATDATVLLEGETGTGKDAAAETVHLAGTRRDGPFVVIDCGAIPENLLESELFGHERGAFTGAGEKRIGAFESADKGTVFLDEIGELPPPLQPKLLRALDRKVVRRVGSNAQVPVDVRLVAATNRDLRAEVNAGRFRSDLYFRLAVVRVRMPPLRERPEDIPLLIERIAPTLGLDDDLCARLLEPPVLTSLQRTAWPGNVRELVNYLERCVVMEEALEPGLPGTAPSGFAPDLSVPFAKARRRVTAEFERRYLQALLAAHDDVVARAARAAGIDRVFLHKLLKRHGLR